MGTIVVGAIFTLLQSIANGVAWLLANVLASISQYSLIAAQQPWVQQVTQVSVAVASGLFTVRVIWEATSQYILWNEGTADHDGGQIWKGILRTAVYGAAGTWLVYNVFQFGIWYGAALMASPLNDAVAATQNVTTKIMALPGLVVEDLMILILGVVILLLCMVITTVQMAVRGAELIYFVVASPFAALGQFNPDGGIWNSWWSSLVVLSMSQAVQWLGIKAVIGSMQIINTGASNVVATGALECLSICLAIGAIIATVRGPHLLKEWSYRTGIGGGVQTVSRQWIMSKIR